MSFMTFVLTGGVLTPDIAFVSLTLFNIMRMPMTSTYFIPFFPPFFFHFPIKSLTFLLFFFSSSVLPILIVQFVQVRFLKYALYVRCFRFARCHS